MELCCHMPLDVLNTSLAFLPCTMIYVCSRRHLCFLSTLVLEKSKKELSLGWADVLFSLAMSTFPLYLEHRHSLIDESVQVFVVFYSRWWIGRLKLTVVMHWIQQVFSHATTSTSCNLVTGSDPLIERTDSRLLCCTAAADDVKDVKAEV